jgi:hypothetical protein
MGVVVVESQPQLLQVVLTHQSVSPLSNILQGGQQQGQQNGDDGDHHQYFNEREAAPVNPR